MRRAIVDNLLVSFYVNNAIMPICDDSGIIPGAGFPVIIIMIIIKIIIIKIYLKKKPINTRSVTTGLGQLLQAAVIIAWLIRHLRDALCLARLI